MQLTPAQLAQIRSQPQEFNLYMNIYQPETLLAGQINDTVSRNDMDIPVGAFTTGTLADVPDNFLLMVGTTPGSNNKGTVRIRFASGTHLCVAENNNISWASGQYITVLNYIDVDAVYPRIIQDPGDPENVIFYKDYDIAYTNQNTKLGSFVCMGPHRAAFRDPATGIARLYWSASGTYNVNGRSLTYAWEFEGATTATSTDETPGWIEYNHAGDFIAKLTVSSAYPGEDAEDVSYRFVSIKDRPEAGPNRPLTQWSLDSLQGSRSEGGFTTRVKIWEPVDDINYLKDGALVVIFSDDRYANVPASLGGNAENCAEIFFVGYILKGSIGYDFKQGNVTFDIGSVTEMMKMSQGFSVSCQDDPNPNTWFKIKNLTVPKAIYHYMRWHSTVPLTTDFQYLEDDRAVQYFDTDRESLYDAIARFLESGMKAELVADRQGKLWGQVNAANTYQARTAFPDAMTITKNDWTSTPESNASANAARAGGTASSPNITERIFPELSYLEYGGIKYTGLTGTSSPLLSAAPGQTPGYKGGIEQHEGLILLGQTELNRMVGAAFAAANSKYPEIYFSLAGAYKNLDIAPIEAVRLRVDADDTPRGISIANEPFYITSQEWSYDPKARALIQTPHFAQLVNGLAGETIVVPPPPDDQGNNVPGTKVPPYGWGYPIVTGTHGTYGYFEHRGISWGAGVDDNTDTIGMNGVVVNGVMKDVVADTNILFFPPSDGVYLCGIHLWVAILNSIDNWFLSIDILNDINKEYAHIAVQNMTDPSDKINPELSWSGMLYLRGGTYLKFSPRFNSASIYYGGDYQAFCNIYMYKID